MSGLSSKLTALTQKKHVTKSIITFFNSLSDEDKDLVWTYLTDPDYKTYTLLRIFKEEGAGFNKDTFSAFRKNVLSGEITRSDLNG